MKYLGIVPHRPRIAVFDFTSCEGCELQLVNKEETLGNFLQSVEIVAFREVTTAVGDDYDIALIEGSVTREDEVERLKAIRARAKTLVALGSCACFGGVNRQKNAMTSDELNRIVYGDQPKPTLPARALKEVVRVDFEIPGCPISKYEVERIVQHLALEIPYSAPDFPVCVDCKQRFISCLMDQAQLCLGSVTRAGCDAPCPAGGLGCWGCRGPAADANVKEFVQIAGSRGFAAREIHERLGFFGGFEVAR